MSIVKLDEDSSAIYAFVTLVVEISTRGIRLLLWIFFSLNNKPSLNALTQKDSSRGTIFRCMGVFHESLSGTYLLGLIIMGLLDYFC